MILSNDPGLVSKVELSRTYPGVLNIKIVERFITTTRSDPYCENLGKRVQFSEVRYPLKEI